MPLAACAMLAVGCTSDGHSLGKNHGPTDQNPDAATMGSGGSNPTGTGGSPSGSPGSGGAPEGTGGDETGGTGGDPGDGGPECPFPVDTSGLGRTATVDLDTFCTLTDCKKTPDEILRGYTCAPGTPSGTSEAPVLTLGCGITTIAFGYGYGGSSKSYEGGNLFRGRIFSDVQFGPCLAFAYATGTEVACTTTETLVCTPVDSLSGCRSPGDPGCDTCCTPSPSTGTCTVRSAGGADWYNVTRSDPGTCDPGCSACARCSDRDEAQLRALPDRPDCDCTVDPGIDPCFGPTSCGCWCTTFEYLTAACPDVAR